MRVQRARLKSQWDDLKVAQGKRGTSAALGNAPKLISSFSLPVWRAASTPNRKGKRGWVGWLLTQDGGLDGLVLGYFRTAPFRAPKGQQGARGLAP